MVSESGSYFDKEAIEREDIIVCESLKGVNTKEGK